jgi:hypothetical protein
MVTLYRASKGESRLNDKAPTSTLNYKYKGSLMFLGAPIVQMAATSFGIDIPLPELPTDYLFELLLGLLGMAGIRSFDKLKGNSG